MLFDHTTSIDEIWKSVQAELRCGVVDARHPFRFMVLATSDGTSLNQRYVVLRDMDDFMNLYLFSDSRTRKVRDLSGLATCSVLLYHPEKRTQIRIAGHGTILHNEEKGAYWSNVQGDARKAYTSVRASGTPIEQWKDAYEWDASLGSRYFEVIKVQSLEMEVLQLNQPEHLRIHFMKNDDDWKGQILVP